MADTILRPEILVIGAGPGGSAAAWALAGLGHDVLMIDAAVFPRDKTCGDGLTPMAVRTLAEMGVLPQIEAAGAAHIDNVRIKGPIGLDATMSFGDYQPDHPYALVLPRLKMDDILRRYAIANGVEHMGGVRVEAITRVGDKVTAVRASSLAGELLIEPQQVVIAVGANMGLLKREGFIKHKPRFIRAIRGYYANVSLDQEVYDFYFDFELLPGYGWIFPTGDNRANIGIGVLPVFWSTRKNTRILLDEFLQRRLKDKVIGRIEPVGQPKGYPLRIDFPDQRTAGDNWVIVGESAGLVNPVTGEGIDLALESGLIAARTLHADIQHGRRNHLAYQRELWDRFGPMFTGLRALRDILITPFFTDYALWLMRQHPHLTATVMKMAEGLEPPQDVFHPLFVLEFFTPFAPRFIVEQATKLLTHNGHNGNSGG